jgi:flavin reductase (DIM6/NTAB) family NADH-FMN oxidoreductase RutF
MAKVEVAYDTYARETVKALANPGLLLAARGARGGANAMAIGWGAVGVVWGRPTFVVLVRPSRYTYGLIETAGDFTVNVMSREHAAAVQHCGSVSGRRGDKLAQCGLTTIPGLKVSSPALDAAVIIYECRVIHANDVIPEKLDAEVAAACYPKGDFHRLYYGEILCVRAEPDAAERL